MGREIRRVPADWDHPTDERGSKPLHESFPYGAEEVREGIRDGWLRIGVMPDWRDSERTHYQLYENVTEGTPLSPPMESEEALSRWLFENPEEAHLMGDDVLSYEQWLSFVRAGSAPSLIVGPGGIKSGVAAIAEETPG